MKIHRRLCGIMWVAVLAGCAGQASPYTMQALVAAQAACASGDQNACATMYPLQAQASYEAQQNAQANSATAASILGVLLGAAALGVAASNGGGYHGGYYHGGYHRGWR